MKKWIFSAVVFLLILFSTSNSVYANVVWISGDYYKFYYTTKSGSDVTEYIFGVEFSSLDKIEFNEKGFKPDIRILDSTNYSHVIHDLEKSDFSFKYDEEYGKNTAYWTGTFQISNDISVNKVYLRFYYLDSNGERQSQFVYADDITEPDPTPTSTPKPTPTNTPVPTPTNTPKPTPTNTPVPTPTNSPTPTPTPTPLLELYAFTTKNDAVAQYRTGGFTPVKSVIEFYEIDKSSGVTFKLDSYEFLSGSGTRRDLVIPGKTYRYKLTYIYIQDDVQYEKFIWSDDLSVVDQELEDYRSNKKINNFRTLMIYTWEEILALELPIEGFHISFQTIIIWFLVAVAIVLFFKWYRS